MSSEFVPVPEELAEPQCRQLLETVLIGRIGLSERALPTILPVHFTVHGGEVVTVPLDGGEVLSARQEDVVVFEADSYDPAARAGWVVTVIGRSRLITDPAEMAELHVLALAPWAAVEGGRVTAVRMEVVRGRRLRRRSAAEGPAPRPAA